MPYLIDLTGQKFGRWTVIRYSSVKRWLCRCECGTVRTVQGYSLSGGLSQSCGCLDAELKVDRARHGNRRRTGDTFEYRVWCGMKQRCLNPAIPNYANYGGRGIVVCERWLDDFAAFLEDMGAAPSTKHSLDRIDNDGPYSPENCRWATRLEQNSNSRHNRLLTINGVTNTLSDWARVAGIHETSLRHRVDAGWPTDKLLLIRMPGVPARRR